MLGVRVKGAYLLVVQLKKGSEIEIGSLGKVFFKKGDYVYIGSAMNNLEKRVERHKKKEKKVFWHIDYLLSSPNAELKKVFLKPSKKKEECMIANKIAGFGTPVIGFGCSDCKCKSHLYKESETGLLKELGEDTKMPKEKI